MLRMKNARNPRQMGIVTMLRFKSRIRPPRTCARSVVDLMTAPWVNTMAGFGCTRSAFASGAQIPVSKFQIISIAAARRGDSHEYGGLHTLPPASQGARHHRTGQWHHRGIFEPRLQIDSAPTVLPVRFP